MEKKRIVTLCLFALQAMTTWATEYYVSPTGSGNVYIGCRSWNNSDDGWDSFERVTDGTPTVYINCITYNNGPEKYDLSSHPRVTGVDKDLSCFSGKDLANFSNGGNPNGFKVGGKGTKHNVELYRCLAVGHRSKGFDQNNNAGSMKVINCTAYANKNNYGFGNQYDYTLVIKNNTKTSFHMQVPPLPTTTTHGTVDSLSANQISKALTSRQSLKLHGMPTALWQLPLNSI